MNDIYTHYFANSRHDGFINLAADCKGEVSWEFIVDNKPERHSETRIILVSDDKIFVDSMSEIVCLDISGKLLWKRDKWYGTQIVINNGSLFFTSAARKDRMHAVDFNNNLVLEDFVIWEIIDRSFLVLFEPSIDQLIAQVQYTGLQEVASDKIVIYKIGKKSLGYDWSKIYLDNTSLLIPLVNHNQKYLLTSNNTDILIFKLDEKNKTPEPNYSFPIPDKTENIFASSAEDGKFYLAYSFENKIILKCYDHQAIEFFTIEHQEEFYNFNKVVAPPILTKDLIYIVTEKRILCIRNESILWTYDWNGKPISHATGLADNSILLSQTDLILQLDSEGKKVFSKSFSDTLITPPVVDKTGKVLVASKSKIYCLE